MLEIEPVFEIAAISVVGVYVGVTDQGVATRDGSVVLEGHGDLDNSLRRVTGKDLGESEDPVRGRAYNLEREGVRATGLGSYRS